MYSLAHLCRPKFLWRHNTDHTPREVTSEVRLNSQRAVLIILPAVAGAIELGLVSSTWGMGANSDSVSYISEAHNILAGRGISSLHYAPLYSYLLAGIQLVGPSALDAARWANCVLFSANILMVAFLLRRQCGSHWVAGFGAALMATSVDMLQIHFMVWPEPLFVFGTLWTLVLTQLYLESGRRRFLIAAALCAGVTTLTRYPGLALVASIAIAQFTLTKDSLVQRLQNALLVATLGLVPIGTWLASNGAFTGQMTVRTLAFHPITIGRLVDGLSVASRWLVPVEPPLALRVVVTALVVAAVTVVLVSAGPRLRRRERTSLFWFLSITFVFSYTALLLLSITLFDESTPLDSRIMSPVYPVALITAVSAVYRLVESLESEWLSRGLIVVSAVLLISYLPRAWDWGVTSYTDGRSYTGKVWRESGTIRETLGLPLNTTIFSNAPDVITILLNRRARMLPKKFDPTSGLANAHYNEEIERVRFDLENHSAVLVYFQPMRRTYLPSLVELTNLLPLQECTDANDGAICRSSSRTVVRYNPHSQN